MADCATLCANLANANAELEDTQAQLEVDEAAQAMASMAAMEGGCDCAGGGMAMPVFSDSQMKIINENPVMKKRFDRLTAKLAKAAS